MPDGDRAEDTYISDIAPDVMRVLKELHFFEKLDDQFCPIEEPPKQVNCPSGSFEISTQILRNLGMNAEEVEDVIAVLHSAGACCDCEVLYNVAQESRPKVRYWKARYA